ncbi:penicillin-binding transpeptidase domain-containing protein [Streptomyces sp. NPDC005017]|uniref:penicillin-binding transpeptidase domain-containing protein n=1 Tax=Streptomyces sp. NPDC005017 TaxID=3364706 RepID=UPI0036BE9B8A
MRKGVRGAVVGTVFAAMIGGAGYGAFNLVSALGGDGGSGPGGSTSSKSGPPDEDEVAETTKEFFAAWEQGRGARAASFTNNAADAEPVLTSFGGSAHLTDVRITPGTPSGTTVPFSVRATVSYKGAAKPLEYDSQLTVVRGITTGRALVDWQPTVVHPELVKGDTLVTEESASPPIEAVARDGSVLTKDEYPSLGPVLDDLRERYGHEAGGTRGVELSIRHTATGAADTALLTLTEGRAGRLPTTISPRLQAAAEKAVTGFKESSVVAVKPSTGEILAIANNRVDKWNAAFEGELAPGSTMKIISAAMLIDNGLTTADGPAPCPPKALSDGHTFNNLKGLEANEDATLADSFARSCNTAFVKFADEIQDDSLTKEAQERFGLGRDDWKAGVTTFDGSVPVSEGPDTAAALLGQGKVQMSPLNMASVTATAITGSFRQPVIVPQSLDGRTLARAEGLRPSTVDQLRALMNRTATSGTGQKAMSGLSGDIGAKTGSAEVDGQATSNSWFTGFRGDVAAAAMAQQGGHGSDAAGPIVAQVLRAGG